jgi:predicted outer membrane repeat protein
MKNLIFPLISLFLFIPCQAGIITVDDDGPADFNNIQAAIEDANDGDVIIVKQGRYTGEGNRDIDFLGKAITVRSTDPNDPNIVSATIIDCNGTEGEPHRGFYFHSDEDANSVLDGFTITNGSASIGAGINCSSTSPTIRHCLISGNTSRHHGGGLYCKFSSPVITNCTLRDNTAIHGHGGGVFCFGGSPDISTCIISDNHAGSSGGGLFNNNSGPVLLNCNFSNNSAGDYGGGVCNTNNSIPIMTDCTFADNHSDYCGDDTYSEGESCPDLNNRVTDAKMYNIMSSGRLSGKYQMRGSSGTTYYVNGLCGNDCWAGTDPCCVEPNGPKQTIQGAINDAEDSATIIVYPHIYLENITIEANDISLTSIDPNDPNVVEATVIDGRGRNSVVKIVDANVSIEGFTIQNGGGYQGRYGGGIYCASNTESEFKVTISKNVIQNNSLNRGYGAGIYGNSYVRAVIVGNIIQNNTISQMDMDAAGGGGFYCAGADCEITDNTVIDNLIDSSMGEGFFDHAEGGGIWVGGGLVSDNTVLRNSVRAVYHWGGQHYVKGGGIYCDGPTTVTRNRVEDNELFCWGGETEMGDSSEAYGGGIFAPNSEIILNIVKGNISHSDGCLVVCPWQGYEDGATGIASGGGIYAPGAIMKNNLVTNNQATGNGGDGGDNLWKEGDFSYGGDGIARGGGIYAPEAMITNNTVAGNQTTGTCGLGYVYLGVHDPNFDGTAISKGTGIYADSNSLITSTIVWDNSPNQLAGHDCNNVAYCDISDGICSGVTSNISADPCFVDPNSGDYHLLPDSPCIDAGDPNYVAGPNETDLDGNPRIVNGVVDMGAFEAPLLEPGPLLLKLTQDVIALNLQQGIENGLDAKLDAAMQALEDVNENNDVAAINTLEAFINAIEAQRGNKIPEADADALIADVLEIIELLSA